MLSLMLEIFKHIKTMSAAADVNIHLDLFLKTRYIRTVWHGVDVSWINNDLLSVNKARV